MTKDSLGSWARATRSSWGPISTDLISDCRRYLERLALTPATEGWLAALHRDRPANQELYRDPDHGFVLLAHAEPTGLFRPPHNHGHSWVMYAVQQGEVEMGTYANVPDAAGGQRLVKRNSTRLFAGQVQVFLPGDIHDTLCVIGPALLFRFTERDLQIEKRERRLTRYAQFGDVWKAEAA